jgi:hypothetical protein
MVLRAMDDEIASVVPTGGVSRPIDLESGTAVCPNELGALAVASHARGGSQATEDITIAC